VDELLEQEVDKFRGDEERVSMRNTLALSQDGRLRARVGEHLKRRTLRCASAAGEMAELQLVGLLDSASRRSTATMSAASMSSTATEPIETYGWPGRIKPPVHPDSSQRSTAIGIAVGSWLSPCSMYVRVTRQHPVFAARTVFAQADRHAKTRPTPGRHSRTWA